MAARSCIGIIGTDPTSDVGVRLEFWARGNSSHSPNTHNPDPNATPTSEVGSEPFKALQEQMALMRELIQTLAHKPGEQRPSAESKNATLPRFDPEGTGADPSAWCAHADLILKDHPMQDSALLSALNRALKGSAAHWLSQVVRGGKLTWPTLKEQFLSRFGGRETAASALIRISRERPSETESPGAYGSRLRSMLQMKLQDLTMPEVINALALYILSSQDQRFQRLTLANNIRTEDQFHDEMRILPYNDQPTFSSRNPPAEPEAKRRKLSAHHVKCLYCGKQGHRIAECRRRMQREQRGNTQRPEGRQPATSPQVVCFKCKAEGHIAPNCPQQQDGKSSPKNKLRVDVCVMKPPVGSLSHLGESFPFYFDSGAECSLVKESVASKFSGKRTTDVIAMHGIGNACVKSTSQILSVVRISDFTLEIAFHVLDDSHLKSPYRLSEEERRTVRERISELIEAKIIRPSSSPFASPMILVKKKDGSDRLCVDFRALNKNTVADRYPLPLIADQIARLQKARYFISLDMASGFHQIPIHPNSTEYTAFVTPDGQYEYLTMPFGLKNAPSVFQRAILNALGDLAYSYVVVYLDDVLIIADSIDQALERLNTVLDTLVKEGFSFNFSKCSFLTTSVLYLGYVIRDGEVRPNPGKIHALSSLPAPTTVTQLRQFIGLATYFRKFVPKFSQIMKPLYALTSGNKSIAWTDKHEKIRQKVISVLTEAPIPFL
ncbi:uncharacterized protein [Bombus flavifrons]|uniref:uncharacterized protein n=1 Tax=Bombus flavifrons TaxID=103934 RepID=UPI0037048C52